MMSTSLGPTSGIGDPFEPSRKRRAEAEAEPLTKPKPGNNRLLAGYLAHEFLTRGTLLGEPIDQCAEPKPPLDAPAPAAYADVARLLKGESGARVPGVVNPTQLARWLHKR